MVSGKSKHSPWIESKSSGSPKVCFSMSEASISYSILQKYQVHRVILLQYKLKDIMSEKELGRIAVWIYSLFLLLSYWSRVLKELLQFVLLNKKKTWFSFYGYFWSRKLFFSFSKDPFLVKAFIKYTTYAIFISATE